MIEKTRIKTYLRATLALFSITIFFSLPTVGAATMTANSWTTAKVIKTPLDGKILYGKLRPGSEAIYYQISISRPSSIAYKLSVPLWSVDEFKPQIILYQPDGQTIGPVTGLIQPPGTIASIYPSTTNRRNFNLASCINQRIYQNSTITFPAAGKYYLSVYNAGSAGGRWRLSFGQNSRLADLILWPHQWWSDQAWVGWTMQTMFVPLWLLALLGLGWLVRPQKKIKKTGRKKQ